MCTTKRHGSMPATGKPRAAPKPDYAVLTESTSGKKIKASDGLHLGRAEFPVHESPRELPPVFQKARVAVMIPDPQVSRNHALILSEERNGVPCWVIHDLNSHNGTFVNGMQMQVGRLEAGDIVRIGRVELRFSLEQEFEYGALVVTNNAFPSLERDDIPKMVEELKRRGWKDDKISVLEQPTREAVFRMLETYEAMLTEDSLFVFCFSGQGEMLGLAFPDGFLNATQLYAHLGNMRGQKLVILDAAHTKPFFDVPAPHGTLVMGAKQGEDGEEKKAPRDYVQGYLIKGLVKILGLDPSKIDLKRVAERVNRCHTIVHHTVQVHAAGSSVMLDSR